MRKKNESSNTSTIVVSEEVTGKVFPGDFSEEFLEESKPDENTKGEIFDGNYIRQNK